MNLEKSGLSSTRQTHLENSQNNISSIDSADLSFIKFEGIQVRIIKINNEPWFIAKDICNALGITNSSKALMALDLDEKNTVTLSYGIQGNPERGIVSESGFYKLIARSRKATTQGSFAHRFTNWVFREVIPSIRKTDGYGVPFAELNDFTKRQQEYKATSSQYGRNLQSCKEKKEKLKLEEKEMWLKYQPDLLGVEELH